MAKIWQKYSLGITLAVMFLVAWALMTWTDWHYFIGQQQDHHQVADVFGPSGYIWRWGLDTFSNWQADFLGQGLGIVLGAYLLFKGSEQSRDSSDEVEQTVRDIERQVRGSQAASQAQRSSRMKIARRPHIWRYGLGYTLLGAFVVSWALMTWMGWMHFAANAKQHGETAELWGTSGYIWEWMRQTFSNWQADLLGHGALVVVPAYLLYKGSAESRGGMDRVEAAVRRVQQALQNQQDAPAGSTVRETRPRQTSQRQPMSFWNKYGLGIFLLGAFLLTWILQTWSGWGYFLSQQMQHHQTAEVFGSSGYIWLWGVDTFSNWQSDLLWDGLIVLMGAYLIYQGSAESRDTDDRIEELATSIERQVRGQSAADQAQAQTARQVHWGGIWRNRGLAYSLIAAGVISWILMTWMGWMYFSADQQQHHTTAEVFGASGYIWDWGRLTLQNWQSDILGNAAVVILSAYLLYQGSGMSREGDDEIEQTLQRIQQALQSKQQTQIQPAPADNVSAQSRSRRR